jgi:polar amino acid transport system substrate-binding protein
MFLVLGIVLGGFILINLIPFIINLIGAKRDKPKSNYSVKKLFDSLLAITDAIGLAAFTVTGVLVCMIVKAEPLWLWGPFFAFLTGAGGGVLRDVIIKKDNVEAISGEIYSEIAIFWGFILSSYLVLSAADVDPLKIEIAVVSTILLTFITRLFVYFFGIPNLNFVMKSKRLEN